MPDEEYFKLAANKPKVKHITYHSLPITIEWPKGRVRRGKSGDGTAWKRRMHYSYGYIRRTEGVDGDRIDCYVGPEKDAKYVYVVEQCNPKTRETDEFKCMIGFGSEDHARSAYLLHYPSHKFLKSITKIPTHEFVEKIKARKYDRKKIAEVIEDCPTTLWTGKGRYKGAETVFDLSLVKHAGQFTISHPGATITRAAGVTDDEMIGLTPTALSVNGIELLS